MNVLDMDREMVRFFVSEIVFKRQSDHGEGKFLPEDLVFLEQLHIQAFRTRLVFSGAHICPEHHIDLVDMRNTEDAVEFDIFNRRAGFFPGFAGSGLLR